MWHCQREEAPTHSAPPFVNEAVLGWADQANQPGSLSVPMSSS